MPLLFAVGQHSALDAIQEDLPEGEVLLAHHDDIDTVSPDPERVSPMYATLQDHLYSYVRIFSLLRFDLPPHAKSRTNTSTIHHCVVAQIP